VKFYVIKYSSAFYLFFLHLKADCTLARFTFEKEPWKNKDFDVFVS